METAMNENYLLLKEKLKKVEHEYSPDDNDSGDNWPDSDEPAGLPLEKTVGPKILGSRRSTLDDALESRIISIKMQETKSDSIPLVVDDDEFLKDFVLV